ncbi:L-glyceraldehyde 3-phosphate reductase [Brevibacterium sp. CFH 10365]|uniref:L-glyceraldehyde 3-phosphate reductase n=1 Tax=Brevibacterium sp. CFH 10365 TaxID=2585207 RepID=UPI001266154C|nr:L-glyceraldehyde 3-phosphate reductase [Brevibacterium sp. CFH 10365]
MFHAAENRYDSMTFRPVGRSGLVLPALSLGLWHNFGDDVAFQNQRDTVRRAFDLGITHFDLANNYGPPPGSAEINFGRLLREDLHPYRDELIISTKAGWNMHPGPYGGPGGSRKYLLASLDASLRRLGLDYVDIFYSHRPDASTPLEETIGALDTAVRSGRALYAGISSYSAADTARASQLARDFGTPLLIHQPSYSMINRWIEDDGLLETTNDEGLGVICFSPLAQGLLTDKYLRGVPAESRAGKAKPSFKDGFLSEDNLARIRRLNDIAAARGQSLAQMALSWALRDDRVSSLVIGASRVEQLEHNVAALDAAPLSVDELRAIDEFAVDSGVDIWGDARRSTAE